jgi:hypothetical protein
MSFAAARPIRSQRVGSAAAALYVALLLGHLLGSLGLFGAQKFPNVFDELDHFSTVRDLAERPTLWFDPRHRLTVDMREFGGRAPRPNLIAHPPYYYLAMAAFLPQTNDLSQQIDRLRKINALWSTATLALLFFAAFKRLESFPEHLAFGLAVALCPLVRYLGGAINNDQMALFGAALVFLGMSRGRELDRTSVRLVAAGFVCAATVKLNLVVLLSAWIAIYFLLTYGWRSLAWSQRDSNQSEESVRGELVEPRAVQTQFGLRQAQAERVSLGLADSLHNEAAVGRPVRKYGAILLAAASLSGIPYIANLWMFGAAFPLDLAAITRPVPRLDALHYLGSFASQLVTSFAYPGREDVGQTMILFALVALAIWGAYGARRATGGNGPALGRVALSALAAGLVFLAVHFWGTYDLQLLTGYRSACSFRYYLPIWPGVALGLALAVRRLPDGPSRHLALAAGMAAIAYSMLGYAGIAGLLGDLT